MPASSLTYHVQPGARLNGALRMPGDKSISHRAVILGALAEGTTRINGLLQSHDVLATLAAMRALGVDCDTPAKGEAKAKVKPKAKPKVKAKSGGGGDILEIRGAGVGGLRAPAHELDMGNSGTAMRLLAGVLAGQSFESRLVGDASLSRRPMERVLAPLREMGADISAAAGDTAPLLINPVPGLRTTKHTMRIASAQVKSALLLAGLYAADGVTVCETTRTRDHTENMLRSFGAQLQRDDDGCITLAGGARLRGRGIEVPGDISSAAFFMVGATISPGSDVVLRNTGINPTRTGIITILLRMGAHISGCEVDGTEPEPRSDLRVRHAPLRGITIEPALVPSAIDEFPAIAVAAACARGRTVIDGAAELRVKESDRIRAIVEGLRQLGVTVEEREQGMVIEGRGDAGDSPPFAGGTIHSHGDHRVAMAFTMAAVASAQPLRVLDCDNVATSFPDFVASARSVGMALEEARS